MKTEKRSGRWRALAAVVASVGLVFGLSASSAPVAQAGVYSATISGTYTVGETLTATSSGFAGPVVYTWYVHPDGTSPGPRLADGDTYVLTSSETGKYISIIAFYTLDMWITASSTINGPVEAASSPVFTPGTPQVYGTAQVGKPLDSWVGSWSPDPDSYAYQWLRDDAQISGANSYSYVIQAADLGHRLSLKVTASKTGYEDASATSEKTAVVQAAPQATLTSVSATSAVIRTGKCVPISVKAAYQVLSSVADQLSKLSVSATVKNSKHAKIGTVTMTGTATALTGTLATTFQWCGGDKLGKVTFSSWKGSWTGSQTYAPVSKDETYPVSGTITSTKTATAWVRTIVRFRQTQVSSVGKKRTVSTRFVAYRPKKQDWTGVGKGAVVTVEKKVGDHWVKVATDKTDLAGRVTATWKASHKATYRLVWAGSGSKRAWTSHTIVG